ncbi:hypothetical protein M433DRAFT_139420 [Acidomyces richmondensis BFW]|nr:MAG: hypothetical protein FE78DRAFT_78028 [Acidomyces sp. 'richmondensis']KYG50094.1 hypothetical protein M433DRAFT_139420 [Acidomyces richmondensis BFW]
MRSTGTSALEVAIIGGGLCGISLAIALKNRSIPFTIYETRSSFTELGHGINLGPNALEAFKLIDSSLGEAVLKLCTRNASSKEDIWFQIRFGASSGRHEDAELITELVAPPTGNATVVRNELLQLLADKAGSKNARFNKKLVSLEEDDECVTLRFADGTHAIATVAIGCDGIHSAVRRAMLGDNHPGTVAKYSGMGAYRAVIDMSILEAAVGEDQARTSQVYLGPNAYVIMYPVDQARKVNVGFWPWKRTPWPNREWILPDQKKEMESDFREWGQTVHNIMGVMGSPPFFATHHHVVQPDRLSKGRICVIGDAAHSMPPHQGAGAGQAIEDAFVLAEVMNKISRQNPTMDEINAAFTGYESVRTKRSNKVAATSQEAMGWWADFYEKDISDDKISRFVTDANARFDWIWHDDIENQATTAIRAMSKSLGQP